MLESLGFVRLVSKSQLPTALTFESNRFDVIILSNQGYSTVNYYFKK